MEAFSLLTHTMQRMEDAVQAELYTQPASPWTEKQRAEDARLARVVRSQRDFWYYDRTYFPPEMHRQYAKPGKFHRELLGYFLSREQLHVVAASRKFAKTAYAKKILTWMLLTGRVHFIGTLAETLIPTSRNILRDVITLIEDNPRITADWRIDVIESNADQFAFRVGATKDHLRKVRYGQAFSEERSVRGATRQLNRPELLYVDDLETAVSPLGREQVERRIRILAEAHQSLGGGTTVVACNLFDERCAMNQMRRDYENGLLPANYLVHVAPAWSGKRSGWAAMFPAETEEAMRTLMSPLDESDWQGNYQQNPVPPEGVTFTRAHYREENAPDDARGVLYCDPNLSKKGKGDSTAMVALTYSPETDCYYVQGARCKSYSDSNELLSDYLHLKLANVRRMGFDGHVTQESTWSNNVRLFCRIRQMPMPPIVYCRYRVDDCAKNLQLAYNEGRLRFPIGFSASDEGQRFLAQFFAFAGKKAGKADDAPDGLICAFEFIHEQRLVPRKASATYSPHSIALPNYYDTLI